MLAVELASPAPSCDTAALMTRDRSFRFFAFTGDIGAGLPSV